MVEGMEVYGGASTGWYCGVKRTMKEGGEEGGGDSAETEGAAGEETTDLYPASDNLVGVGDANRE